VRAISAFTAAVAALALASLACQTINRLSGSGPLPSTPAAVPTSVPLPGSSGPDQPPQSGDALMLPDGPTIGAGRDARIARDDGVVFLETLATETYTAEDFAEVGRTYDYTISLDTEQPGLVFYGWCATTAQLLQDNLSKMTITFQVNGQAIEADYLHTESGTDGDLMCSQTLMLIYDWPEGETQIEVIVAYNESVNDGMDDYGPGEQRWVYTVRR
jgi:hypothetical protein